MIFFRLQFKNFAIYVAVEGREKELLDYKNKFNISVPILIDKDGSVAEAYKVRGLHETFSLTERERPLEKHTYKRIGHR